VSLEVEEGPPVLKVKPDNRNVSSSAGTTTFDVSNTGGGTMNWVAEVTTGGSWLTIQSGSQHGTNSGTITAEFTANPEATARIGKIRVGAVGASGSPAKVTVTQAGALGLCVTPATGLTSSGYVGGPFSPSSKDYVLNNCGETSLNWTAAKMETWTTLSDTGGTLAKGASATVKVSINSNANALAAGTYGDTVTFTNTTNGNGNTTREVSLTVTGMPDLVVSSLTGSISHTGASFKWTVRNQGNGPAGSFYVRMTIKKGTITVGEKSFHVPHLVEADWWTEEYSITVPITAGTYRLYVYADSTNHVSESNESNNEEYITKTLLW